jgi:hypothetical protein
MTSRGKNLNLNNLSNSLSKKSTAFNEAKAMANGSGWGTTELEVEPSITGM